MPSADFTIDPNHFNDATPGVSLDGIDNITVQTVQLDGGGAWSTVVFTVEKAATVHGPWASLATINQAALSSITDVDGIGAVRVRTSTVEGSEGLARVLIHLERKA